MSDAAERHRQQIEAWKGPSGAMWAANEARTERALAPVTEALLKAADPQPGDRVLDIGCGCGGPSLAFAGAVGPTGHVTGVDVSAPLLDIARATAATNTDYVEADAAAHDFGSYSADILASRFGVMFFGDPDAAFANLRKALKPHGRLAMACWRGRAANAWVTVPVAAILTVVPPPPPPHPEEPGPFAFGDPYRVRRILSAGGFGPVKMQELDFEMLYPADPQAAATAIATGPVSSVLLRDQPDDVRAAAIAAIAKAVTPYSSNGFIRLGAAVWIIVATA